MMLRMRDIGGGPVLAGVREGNAAQEQMLREVMATFSDLIELDFDGVEVATASFLREAVFGLRSALERQGVRTPLVALNAAPAVEDDLSLVARTLGTAIVSASSSQPGRGKVLGVLDEAQRAALAALREVGEASASDLHGRVQSVPPVKVTAWNNRLSALASKGVAVEVRHGREKRYRPVMQELEYGR